MTKKDYINIANAIVAVAKSAKGMLRDSRDVKVADAVIGDMMLAIANVMSGDNPRFDRDRFYQYIRSRI